MSASIISEARRHLFRALVQSTVGKRCVPQCTSDCQFLSTSVGCHRQSHGERLAKPLEKMWVPLTNFFNMTTISFLVLVHHSSFSSKQIQKGAMVSVQLFSGQTALWLWMPKNANGPFLSLPFPSGFLREKLSSTQRSTGRSASHRKPPFRYDPHHWEDRKEVFGSTGDWKMSLWNMVICSHLKKFHPSIEKAIGAIPLVWPQRHCKLLLGTAINP